MAMVPEFSAEDLRKVSAYLSEDRRSGSAGGDIPFDELENLQLFALCAQRRMLSDLRKSVRSAGALRARLEDAEARRLAPLTRGGTAVCRDLDPGDLAKTVLHCLNTLEGEGGRIVRWKPNGVKLMMVTFDLWAVWLGKRGEALTAERPKAYTQGPWLWNASREVCRRTQRDGFEQWDVTCTDMQAREGYLRVLRSADDGPEIAAIARSLAQKYAFVKTGEVRAAMCSCPAYEAVRPSTNAVGTRTGKWGEALDEKLIWAWKNPGRRPDGRTAPAASAGRALTLERIIAEAAPQDGDGDDLPEG